MIMNKSTMLGKKIKRLRRERGYTLDKLAEIALTSKGYLLKLENRPNANPTINIIIKLANALGVTSDFLLCETEIPTRKTKKNIFFIKYSQLEEEDQKKIELIVDAWTKVK